MPTNDLDVGIMQALARDCNDKEMRIHELEAALQYAAMREAMERETPEQKHAFYSEVARLLHGKPEAAERPGRCCGRGDFGTLHDCEKGSPER